MKTVSNLAPFSKAVFPEQARVGIIPVAKLDPDCHKLRPNYPGRCRCETGAELLKGGWLNHLIIVGGPAIEGLSPASVYYDYTCLLLFMHPKLFNSISYFDTEGLTGRDLKSIDREILHNKWSLKKSLGCSSVRFYYLSEKAHYKIVENAPQYMLYLESLEHIPSGEIWPKWYRPKALRRLPAHWLRLLKSRYDPACEGLFLRGIANREVERRRLEMEQFVGRPRLFIPEG